MKHLKAKIALALTLGGLLSASTAPVRAHGTQSAVALAAATPVGAATSAYPGPSVAALVRTAVENRHIQVAWVCISAGVVEGLWGLESESSAKSTAYPKNSLD